VESDHARNRSGGYSGDRVNVNGKQDVRKNLLQGRGDIYRVDDPVKSRHYAEKKGYSLHGAEKYGFKVVTVALQMLGNTPIDEAIEADPQEKRDDELIYKLLLSTKGY
jgi:hypothetical protein